MEFSGRGHVCTFADLQYFALVVPSISVASLRPHLDAANAT